MKIYYLSEKFYEVFKECKEILTKEKRSYAVTLHTIDGIIFAIPIRSHVTHKYKLPTPNPDPKKKSGLDFSKAVPILSQEYIGSQATITEEEFKYLKKNKNLIYSNMKKYLNHYKKAVNKKDIPTNKLLCNCSALQYFHKELKIKNIP